MIDLLQTAGLYAGAAAFFGLAFLLPLYFSQARDVRRLREWAALAPDAPALELPPPAPPAIPEVEPVPTEGAAPAQAPARAPAPSAPTTPVTPISPAQRVILDRPASARVTLDRPLIAQSRWQPLAIRLRKPRYLFGLVAAVLAAGVVAVYVALEVDRGEDGEPARQPAVVPGEVEVAVLNGTAVPGLAANVSDDVVANGFVVEAVTNSESPYQQTVVMFERGHQTEAEAVARALGVNPLQPLDAETGSVAGSADVVVIAGEDRARP